MFRFEVGLHASEVAALGAQGPEPEGIELDESGGVVLWRKGGEQGVECETV